MIPRPYPGDTYNPRYWLRQKAGHRYSQSPWKPKRTAIAQLRYPANYVIPLSTYVPEPNPYTDKRWLAMERARKGACITKMPAGRTAEEIGRNSFDIDWRYLGTH